MTFYSSNYFFWFFLAKPNCFPSNDRFYLCVKSWAVKKFIPQSYLFNYIFIIKGISILCNVTKSGFRFKPIYYTELPITLFSIKNAILAHTYLDLNG
jgi:hypothetical protein